MLYIFSNKWIQRHMKSFRSNERNTGVSLDLSIIQNTQQGNGKNYDVATVPSVIRVRKNKKSLLTDTAGNTSSKIRPSVRQKHKNVCNDEKMQMVHVSRTNHLR